MKIIETIIKFAFGSLVVAMVILGIAAAVETVKGIPQPLVYTVYQTVPCVNHIQIITDENQCKNCDSDLTIRVIK